MPAITDQAIVLRTWDFSETSQTLSLLTAQHGVLRALAKGSRRPRSAFDGGLEMLTRGHIGAIVKPTAELATLTEWGLAEIFPCLRRSLEAHRAALYLADLTHNLFQPGDPHPGLFDALLSALRAMEAGEGSLSPVLVFQWRALGEAGYAPIVDRDARTDDPLPLAEAYGFSASSGGLTPDPGPARSDDGLWRLRADTAGVLRELAAGRGFDAGDAAGRAARLLGVYLAWIIGRTLASAASWERTLAPGSEITGPQVK